MTVESIKNFGQTREFMLNYPCYSWWLWCNGSTTGCGPVREGSSPSSHPMRKKLKLKKLASEIKKAREQVKNDEVYSEAEVYKELGL